MKRQRKELRPSRKTRRCVVWRGSRHWGSKKNNWSGLAVCMQVTFRSYPEPARMKKHKRASSLKKDKTLCSLAGKLSLVGQHKEQLIQAVCMQVTFRSYPEAA